MALDCRIIRDDNGNLKKVEAPNGEKSILFDKLKNFFGEKKALELYALTETEAFKNLMSYKRGVFLNQQKEKLNDIRFSIVGEKGALKVEKYNSLLNSAKELEAKGISADEIEKQTGWYKRDGQWKYLAPEILKELQIKDNYEVNKIYKLQDVLQDKTTLLQMYPEMGNIQVVFYDNSSENSIPETKNWGKSEAAYNSEKNILGINSGRLRERGGIELVQRKFAHELTHAVAREEGFPLGGGYFTVFSKVLNLLNLPNGSNIKTVRDRLNSVDRTQFSKEDNDILDEGLRAVFAVYDNNYMTLNDQYRRLMGEVDARLVEDVLQKIQNGENITLPYNQYLQMFAGEDGVDLNTTFVIRDNDVQLSFSQEEKTIEKLNQELIDRLKQNGLSEDVFLMSTEEIDAKLKELGVSDDVRKQVIAYHGSARLFDKFSSEKIGTGVKAMRTGAGFYFTKKESRARGYARQLSDKTTFTIGDEVVREGGMFSGERYSIIENIYNKVSGSRLGFAKELLKLSDSERIKGKEEKIKYLESALKNGRLTQEQIEDGDYDLPIYVNLYFNNAFDYRQLAKKVLKSGVNKNEYPAYLYSVIIEENGNWIDFKKPVDGELYNKILTQAENENSPLLNKIKDLKGKSGKDFYFGLVPNRGLFKSPEQELSEFLMRAGIDGNIGYEDNDIEYVVFDENAITIEEQVQFQKALNKVGIDMIVNGFVVKEYPNNNKILDILITKNIIEKVC